MFPYSTPLQSVAAAYGTGTYGCESYDEGGRCQTVQNSSNDPLAPLTGFFSQPVYVILPVLLALAIVIGSVTYLISRKLRKHR